MFIEPDVCGAHSFRSEMSLMLTYNSCGVGLLLERSGRGTPRCL
jgi:hypothetical protein